MNNEDQDNVEHKKPSYEEYIDYLLGRGWHRLSITIDQSSKDFVSINSVSKGNTDNIVTIRCPNGKIMSIMGTKEIFQGGNPDLAYPFGLYITDEDGKEIPDDTKIRIVKDEPCVTLIQLERSLYSDIKMKNGESVHRFKRGVEFHGGEYIMISVINSQNYIRSENIQFKMKTDLWDRDV